MSGMKGNGSKASPFSLMIGEGLSRDKSISIGHKLGCTSFFRLNSNCLDDPSTSKSVATCSSLNKKECNAGYLEK